MQRQRGSQQNRRLNLPRFRSARGKMAARIKHRQWRGAESDACYIERLPEKCMKHARNGAGMKLNALNSRAPEPAAGSEARRGTTRRGLRGDDGQPVARRRKCPCAPTRGQQCMAYLLAGVRALAVAD